MYDVGCKKINGMLHSIYYYSQNQISYRVTSLIAFFPLSMGIPIDKGKKGNKV